MENREKGSMHDPDDDDDDDDVRKHTPLGLNEP